MAKKYRRLMWQEGIRATMLLVPAMAPFLGAIYGYAESGRILIGFLYFLIPVPFSYFMAVSIYKYFKVHCPICGSDQTRENYLTKGGPVEHKCNSCGSIFIDGVLQS